MTNTLSLLPAGWTSIAERSRGAHGNALLTWQELPVPVLHMAQARALARKGLILMANRHLPDRVELVVRPVIIG